ncbi:DinB family protein [Bacillus mojavensis]|uniref:DinB family protein n=1 Tax=Bacillus mojavensis TaxID=72360 RepID=UPI002DBDE987|nr:DinB family protein [Bacillus mojavensis]MEC1292297.1 DinB family protein [Bacillus mojavensis]MEC1615652.1 DinB family protein [Bacillus mojavensis]MEC1620220.1 DinB family protein [Bacillus mojavensis]MEC1657923.1 DinB family protein [Bacillus mojavensis]MEC1683737.1 DinB family protein [Bacillus mojavensis]
MSIFNEARLETWNEVKGLSDEKLNQKPSSDEWSIREVLEHLKKIDMAAQNMLKEQVKEAPIKKIEEVPLTAAQDRSNKRKAPARLEPDHDFISGSQMKRELDVVREQLTAVIASLKEEDFERVLPHPLFQELTVRQWIDFIGHHEKRHLSQIKEIKEKIERV